MAASSRLAAKPDGPFAYTNISDAIADDDMAKAMMDRIVHHGRLVTYDRESYRVKHALMRGEL